MYSLILVFTLIIISGLIAFVGDWVGLKIGKKRVTIFGLRPHYTAIFVTIISGILIAIITITILAISSNDVRTALFGMEELKEKLSYLSREVELGNIKLSSTREDLKEKTTQLQEMEEKYQKLSEDIKNKTSQLEELSLIRENLIEEKDQLDKEVEELTVTIKALYSGIAWVREGEVIFGSDEQIGLTIIQGQRPIEEIKKELIMFLNEASNKVLAMGAKKDERTNQVFIISQEEFEDITQKIYDSDKEMIVRLLSSINVIEGEPVVAHFNISENKLLFKLDEEIISEEIESTEVYSEVENKLISLLRKVNIIAVKEGIIPDPKTSFVGAVSAINLYDTVKTIVESGTTMKVTVSSIDDTWRTGPLKVRMEAKPIS
ncbi:MAG: hypothetical protein A2163_00450 [Actinobacteria bacterium RBG_13_35_12]|uniref:DUF3084 domain-containing protein n=1 Tax=Candidatus Sediminicultor quintus TaxID=1797291 RepID=A0A1F5A4H8_9BACT|nr:MAG: hypothetical protein A2163_00450 [Actinobacteria bacterium RBG_13_35_12]OGD13455.1 MAG: hypothetical protein A2V47_08815 [Candidatus Atribacteria bacterium RBG_19FT_COMBO_35_14]